MFDLFVLFLYRKAIKMAAPKEHHEYNLIIGNSFDPTPNPQSMFTQLKYTFRPASVDSTKTADLEISDRGVVQLTTAGTEDDVAFKGNFKVENKNREFFRVGGNISKFTIFCMTQTCQK